jgi:hypothetical protein
VATDFPRRTPDQLLGKRYRIEEDLEGGAYRAWDEDTAAPVLLVALTPEEAGLVPELMAFRHSHVVPVLGHIIEPDGSWLTVGWTEGQTLRECLLTQGPCSASDAVRAALRLADALAHLHADGLWHGRLHPQNVVFAPATDDDLTATQTPHLRFGSPAPEGTPYRMPERAADEAGSIADDTWALAVLMVEMLTGQTPPREGISSEAELLGLGVSDAHLREALFGILTKDAAARQPNLRSLRRALARLYVHQVGTDGSPPGDHATTPPPLPHSTPPEGHPVSPRPTGKASSSRRRRIWLLASTGLIVGVGVAWAVSALLPEPQRVVPAVPQAMAGGTADTAPAIAMAEVAVTGDDVGRAAADHMSACVTAYLVSAAPPQSAASPQSAAPPLEGQATPRQRAGASLSANWVCEETDPQRGVSRLRSSVDDAGRRVLSSLGPLAQVTYSLIRQGCCHEPHPLTSSVAGCEQLGADVTAAARAILDQTDVSAPLDAVSQALRCGSAQEVSEAERKAFLQYVQRIQSE